MKLGLIADTHDRLDARVAGLFTGVQHILHAGDVGHPSIIAELELVAPVTVVAGNNDLYPGWRETEIRELGGHRFMLEHIVQPHGLSGAFSRRLRQAKVGFVVFGHTHRPFSQILDGIHFLNPGSAGAPRHGLPASVCLLHLDSATPRPELIDLHGRPLTF